MYNKISFFIIAHADDWQLFMQPFVFDDLVMPGCKVVFIITTAGDAGMQEKFWRAREEGHKSSVRFCMSAIDTFSEFNGAKCYNEKNIDYWSLHHSTTFFLRLPDGNLDGSGFDSHDYQSLSKFQLNKINSLTSLDASYNFSNWDEYVKVLATIISCESEGIADKNIHYLNPDPVPNPGDHADHISTGIAVGQLNVTKSFKQFLYVGYSIQNLETQLSQSDMFWKVSMFAAYEKAVFDYCGYSTLKENTDLYLRWCCSKPFVEIIAPSL
ncbi:MAG: PIG-L family deacetylase [Bacteroidota bacterium]